MDLPKTVRLRIGLLVALLPWVSSCPCALAVPERLSSLRERAEFLAGKTLPWQSVLSRLQATRAYRGYRITLQEQWEFCRSARYVTMQQWGEVHLSAFPSSRGVLRYLFGGPDFLNAHAFFPGARVMILGGLEPVGEVPVPESLDSATLESSLNALNEAMRTSLSCGYFITSEMKPQFMQGSFRGVLPVLLTEIALTGNIIESVSMVRPFGSPGVEIVYHGTRGLPQTVYYFQANLSNGKECRRFLSWIRDFGPGVSYLKAASYLLPSSDFSETRDFLLDTSTLILQDDSGIPITAFSAVQWSLRVYGSYADPLPVFKLRKDPALEAAYRSSDCYAGPLLFGNGYHVRPEEANLLLAVRKRDVAGDPPVGISQAVRVPIRRALSAGSPKHIPSVSSQGSAFVQTQSRDPVLPAETPAVGIPAYSDPVSVDPEPDEKASSESRNHTEPSVSDE